MKKFWFMLLVSLVFLGVCSVQGQDLAAKLRELKTLYEAGDITQAEYQTMRQKLLTGFTEGSSTPRRPRNHPQNHPQNFPYDHPTPPAQPQPPSSQPPAWGQPVPPVAEPPVAPVVAPPGTHLVNGNITVDAYWRAQDLVSLAYQMVFKCDGVVQVGQTASYDEGKSFTMAFPMYLAPGLHSFELSYSAQTRKNESSAYGSWSPKTWTYSFQENVVGPMSFTKVLEFIEKRGLLDSKVETKFMGIDEFNATREKRKKRELEQGGGYREAWRPQAAP